MSAKQLELSRQLLKFIIVGGLSTVLNYGIFWIGYVVLHLNHSLASAIGYIAGLLLGYQLNRRWTFSQAQHHPVQREFVLYCVVYSVSLILGLLSLEVLVDFFRLSPLVANLLVIGQTTVTNFLGLRMVVFKKHL